MRFMPLLLVILAAACNAAPESIWDREQPQVLTVPASSVRVIDGDTLEYDGSRIRLIGWDSPETGSTRHCEQEKTWGRLATGSAKNIIIQAETVSFVFVGRDRYGRGLAHIATDGRNDFGEAMQEQGMAKRWDYDGGQAKPDWCGRFDETSLMRNDKDAQ